jgi:hypothetical protein
VHSRGATAALDAHAGRRLRLPATEVSDLDLRVAVALKELGFPAALADGFLAAATLDYIERVKPLHGHDWLTLVRFAQALATDRISDYLAAFIRGSARSADCTCSVGAAPMIASRSATWMRVLRSSRRSGPVTLDGRN